MALADNTERLIEQLSMKTRIVTDERILKDAFVEFEKSAPYSRKLIIRNTTITKFGGIAAAAAFAVIVWAVYISIFNDNLAAPKKIYNDLASIDNFSISMFHANKEQPFGQIWVSKPLEMSLLKTTTQNSEFLTLWDISRNNKMTSTSSANSIQTEKSTHDKLKNELEESVFNVYSLAHFKKINDIPGNAKWAQIQSPDSDIFELTWQQKDSDGKLKYYKWRFILENTSNLLKRTELYIKSNPSDQYVLDSFSIISYPEQEDIRTLIIRNFNIVISAPEYQPTGGL